MIAVNAFPATSDLVLDKLFSDLPGLIPVDEIYQSSVMDKSNVYSDLFNDIPYLFRCCLLGSIHD